MSVLAKLNVGIVGAAGRGGSFRLAFDGHPYARIHALCDVNAAGLQAVAHEVGITETYLDYAEMLSRSELDAVILGTPMPFHAAQAIQALEAGIHVLSEVTAAVSIQECQALVRAQAQSAAQYMLSENTVYTKPNVLIRSLVQQGLFGTIYYAEGEYLHELRALNEQTPWRRRWQTGVDGITYGTHSLGPILQWMAGDRVARVCCQGSGHHYRDPRGDTYENQDTCIMLAKTRQEALIKIRVDMLSNRPHGMFNYALQGTGGAYESTRSSDQCSRIWLSALAEGERSWRDLADLEERYLPEPWRNPPPQALAAGHGGGDYFVVQDFLACIRGDIPCPLDIHAAMDMTLPGLISQDSIRQGGVWLEVPDSRDWI